VKRLRVYLEPRDAWIGAYVAEKAVYVCPLPFVVIRWERKAKPESAALEAVDPYDYESVSATEREIIFMRLSELESRVASLDELHESAPHGAPHSPSRHPGQMILEQP